MFTNKRLILIDIQGITGSKIEKVELNRKITPTSIVIEGAEIDFNQIEYIRTNHMFWKGLGKSFEYGARNGQSFIYPVTGSAVIVDSGQRSNDFRPASIKTTLRIA